MKTKYGFLASFVLFAAFATINNTPASADEKGPSNTDIAVTTVVGTAGTAGAASTTFIAQKRADSAFYEREKLKTNLQRNEARRTFLEQEVRDNQQILTNELRAQHLSEPPTQEAAVAARYPYVEGELLKKYGKTLSKAESEAYFKAKELLRAHRHAENLDRTKRQLAEEVVTLKELSKKAATLDATIAKKGMKPTIAGILASVTAFGAAEWATGGNLISDLMEKTKRPLPPAGAVWDEPHHGALGAE